MPEDELQVEENIETTEDPQEEVLKTQGSGFSARWMIIVGVVVTFVLVLAVVLFILRMPKIDKSVQSVETKTQTKTIEKSQVINGKKVEQKVVVEKKKKRRKKIKYAVLFQNLESTQLVDVLKELSMSGIGFNTVQRGNAYNVEVEEDKLEEAKNMLALKGLPSRKVVGYELFDSGQSIGVTEFDKRIRFVRAISGELEKAIIQFSAIDDCKVQVVLPEEKLFSKVQPKTSASILIRRAKKTKLPDETVFAIIELVSASVENLEPEHVSVIDTDGYVLSRGLFARLDKKRKSQKNELETELYKAREALRKEMEKNKVLAEKTTKNIGKSEIQTSIVNEKNQKNIKKEKKEKIKKIATIKKKIDFKMKQAFFDLLKQKTILKLNNLIPSKRFLLKIDGDIVDFQNNGLMKIKTITVNVTLDESLKKNLDAGLANRINKSLSFIPAKMLHINILLDSIPAKPKINNAFIISENKKLKIYKIRRYPQFMYKYFRDGRYTYIIAGSGIIGIGGVLLVLFFLYKIYKPKKKNVNISNEQVDNEDLVEKNNHELKTEKLSQLQNFIADNPQVLAKILEIWMQEDLQKNLKEVSV